MEFDRKRIMTENIWRQFSDNYVVTGNYDPILFNSLFCDRFRNYGGLSCLNTAHYRIRTTLRTYHLQKIYFVVSNKVWNQQIVSNQTIVVTSIRLLLSSRFSILVKRIALPRALCDFLPFVFLCSIALHFLYLIVLEVLSCAWLLSPFIFPRLSCPRDLHANINWKHGRNGKGIMLSV